MGARSVQFAAVATAVLLLTTTEAATGRARPLKPAPWSAVRSAMHRTYEVGTGPGSHFASLSRRIAVADGHGGSITAVVGLRQPSADAKGQLTFFFHNRHFLGWDTNREVAAIRDIRALGPRRLSVRYVHYAERDPLCCPSRGLVAVLYTWTGRRIRASGRPPHLSWETQRVGYRR